MCSARDADGSGSSDIGDLGLESSFAVENLDSAIAGVGDVYVALRVDRDPVDRSELTVGRSGGAPGLDEFAALVEFGDAGIAEPVGDIDVSSGVPCGA